MVCILAGPQCLRDWSSGTSPAGSAMNKVAPGLTCATLIPHLAHLSRTALGKHGTT